MRPDRAIVRDLQALDQNLIVVWEPKIQRWQVREWRIDGHIKRDELDPGEWIKKSTLVTTVCFRDDQFNDIGYKPLDQRTVLAVKLSRRYGHDPDDLQKEVDDHNERLENQADQEWAYAVQTASKYLNRYFHQPRVFLGVKGAR